MVLINTEHSGFFTRAVVYLILDVEEQTRA